MESGGHMSAENAWRRRSCRPDGIQMNILKPRVFVVGSVIQLVRRSQCRLICARAPQKSTGCVQLLRILQIISHILRPPERPISRLELYPVSIMKSDYLSKDHRTFL